MGPRSRGSARRIQYATPLLGVATLLASASFGYSQVPSEKKDLYAVQAQRIPLEDVCSVEPNLGVVWAKPVPKDGQELLVTPQDLAYSMAPILWFSPDEPLYSLAEGEGSIETRALFKHQEAMVPTSRHFPRVLPCDTVNAGAKKPLVYYRLANVTWRSGVQPPKPDAHKPINVLSAKQVEVRFFFYYPEDFGANSHRHDLEGASFRAEFINTQNGSCLVARVVEVQGFAHGLNWTANRLGLDRSEPKDVKLQSLARFPMHLLVEEGKHASCPDRNGDGAYTPGYDVNIFRSDAWGIRDDFGSSRVRSDYRAEMTKPRRSENRLAPRLPSDHPLRKAIAEWREDSLYDLVPTTNVVSQTCPSSTSSSEPTTGRKRKALNLRAKVKSEKFDQPPDYVVDSWWGRYQTRLGFSLRRNKENVAVALRLDEPDEGQVGFGSRAYLTSASYLASLPGIDGSFTFRPTFKLTGKGALRGLALQYSPSNAKWMDWYVQVGWQRFARADGTFRHEVVPEFGFKFRYHIEREIPLLQFIGARIGVRNEGFESISNARLVFEIGTGPW